MLLGKPSSFLRGTVEPILFSRERKLPLRSQWDIVLGGGSLGAGGVPDVT
jgi:hypothetical protein